MIGTAGAFGHMEPARQPGPAPTAGRPNDLGSMRFTFLFVVMLATTAAAPRQDSTLSSAGVNPGSTASRVPPGAEPPLDLPVSLDRIRELLSKPSRLQESLLKRPTFKIEVEEQRHVQELLSTLAAQSKAGPAPFGGVYGYETQRVMLSSLSTPLMQPYAAFTGGQLLTLAFEALLTKYLGWRALDAITAADRARAAVAAHAEVARAIVEYCAGLPDGGAGVRMCAKPPAP